ncbi:hypothetical protein [Trichormus variabilis]|uniref:Uncharacterized protein n=1 Tax=Trichormus variabilis SAG 1403-4b TaxID=447716 RepID=A0A3S1BPX3_ANAVA|nr:hypothetical protein [Trichormus variabilis]MBD2629640.1 hypothetical protein [Trichormus variabilis FACHB-164]RUS92942.1 hypothetical protein DSM107003_46890 [Trichormus variabilis SAG 1403-4b]
METQQNYFIIFDTTEGAFLAYDAEKNSLVTYRTEQEARDAFEIGYKKNHEQESATWSASAAIHWMNLQPFVINLPVNLTPMEVITTLANCDISEIQSYSLHSTAVRHTQGIKVDLETCRGYQVSEVKLISPEWWPQETASKSS